MISITNLNPIKSHNSFSELISIITQNGIGCGWVEDSNNNFVGLITDGDLRRALEENNIETLSIDHHAKSDNDLFKNEYIDVNASSVGEILYSFFKDINHKISEQMMLGIYVAVLTDTGSFRHSNTTNLCHQVAVDAIQMIGNRKVMGKVVLINS